MSTQSVLSNTSTPNRKKVTLNTLRQKKTRQEMISMLTAYDFFTAQAVDQAGIDIILVGDSLGMVVLGYENTLPVTMEDMLHHAKAVARGAHFALLVGDMPFLSSQVSVSEAVRNAGRFLQEAGMDAIKLDFNKSEGLVPAIAQDFETGEVLMLAFMNEAAWENTLKTGKATFFSRTRNTLWTKGSTSGNEQLVKEIRIDCDNDTVLLKVEQIGGAACHEGYQSCFFRQITPDGLKVVGQRVFDPAEVYGKE